MPEALGFTPSNTKSESKALRKELTRPFRFHAPESGVPWGSWCALSFTCGSSALHPILHVAWFYFVLRASILWLCVLFAFLFYFGLNEKTKINSTRIALKQNSIPYAP